MAPSRARPECLGSTRSTTSCALGASATMSRLGARLRGEPDDVRMVLPYEEVIAALGFVVRAPGRARGRRRWTRSSGRSTAGGTSTGRFRPTSGRVRSRWEHIAAAMRRGESMPPVDLVRIGEIYFVRDGHHRVSVARALGRVDIDAYVTEVVTGVGAEQTITLADLPLKSHTRVFFERVPLPDDARDEISLTDPWDYAVLAEAVEAWGFRTAQDRGEPIGRRETAFLWLENEYRPGRRDAARGRPDRRPDRDRGLSAHQRRALPAAADPPLG